MEELQGEINAPIERPTIRNSKLGAFDASQQRRQQERDEEFRRQYKQQIKATAILKLETALSTMIPASLNKSIFDIISNVTVPMYKRQESVKDLKFEVPKDDIHQLMLSTVQVPQPV